MENNDNDNNENLRRGNRGRQKVEMVKMKNESNLQVTFSKRRSGLFKKASELCTLCGAEMALVVFSPGRKVFSFGHPSVKEVVERYASCQRFIPANKMVSAGDVNGTMQLIDAHRNANLRELNAQVAQVLGQLELERKRGKEMSKLRKASQAQRWWENPLDELDVEQLGQLKKSLEELKKVVQQQGDRNMMQASAAVNNDSSVIAHTPFLPPPPPLQTTQFYDEQGAEEKMMAVPFHNNMTTYMTDMINMNGGFSNINNNSPVSVVNNHGMMNMASLPLVPPPQPQQNRSHSHGFNNSIGYGCGVCIADPSINFMILD